MNKKPASRLTVAIDIRSKTNLSRRLGRLAHQSVAGLLSALLALQPILVQAQQITPDTSAPATNQPSVGVAPNERNIPFIDIVTPNAQGLSHNKYDSFNVDTQGAILNNFKSEVGGPSVLGGTLPGNPNLKNSNPASIILNEVTKANRSALNGQIEVFGQHADVVIANPNGITCNGCGFINTPRATLTTGRPDILSDGRLSGFTVEGGDVTFGEKGGNFTDSDGKGGHLPNGLGKVDLFDIVSRSVHVDGPVHGQDLRLTVGRDKFNYATREATALTATSGTPEYAIDGSALGAMQAERIKIVVTEKGAGVRMRGNLAANTGELSLSSDGKISIGNASGNQGVTLNSNDKVTAKAVTSSKRVTVRANKGITLESVAADEALELSAAAGFVSVAGNVNSPVVGITTEGDISLGSLDSGSAATLTSAHGKVHLEGKALTRDLTINASAGSITAASLTSNGSMSLNAGQELGVSGIMHATGNLTATASSIAAQSIVSDSGTVTLTAFAGPITIKTLLFAAGNLTVSASTITAQDITGRQAITFNGAVDASGQILGGQVVNITGGSISANLIASGVNFDKTGTGAIVQGPSGDLTLNAVSGAINVATLLSAGELTVTASSLTGQSATAHQNIVINANTTISGQVLGGRNITVTGSSISANLIASGVNFDKTGTGAIVQGPSGDLTLNAVSGSIDVATLLSSGGLTVTAGSLTGQSTTAHQDIVINANTTISGQVLGGRNITVTGGKISAGSIISGVDFAATNVSPKRVIVLTSTGDLTLSAAAVNINSGKLLSGGALNVTSNSFSAQDATAQGNIAINGTTILSGQLRGGHDVTVTGASIKAGSIISGADLAATDKSGKVILSNAGSLTLIATAGNIEVANLLSAGELRATATQNITANAVSHQGLDLTAGGALTLTGQSLSGAGTILKAASITIDDLISGVDFAASGIKFARTKTGTMILDATSGSITAKEILSGGNLNAHALQSLSYNSLRSNGTATLAAEKGSISLDKTTEAQGNLTLVTQSVDLSNLGKDTDHPSKIATSQTLIINAENVKLDHSTLTFGGLILSGVDNLDLTDTVLNAITKDGGSGNIDLKAKTTIITTRATAVLAQKNLIVTLARLENKGQFAAGNDLTMNIAGNLINTPDGLLYSGRDMSLYAPGDILNDRGAILAGRDLKIAANESEQKNRSITNISGTFKAENNARIFTEKLINKRLARPTWQKDVLVANDQVTKFELNPEMLGKPFAHLFNGPNDDDKWLYQDLPPQYWDDYKDRLWSQMHLDEGASYRAWTWIAEKGPDFSANIRDWISTRAPRDAAGNLVHNDPKNPSRFFIRHEQKPKMDISTAYTWDNDANISKSDREDQFDGPLAKEAMIHAGHDLTIHVTELNNEYSSIEAGGNADLKGDTLNNLGVALRRITLTKCNAQGACEYYDKDGKRDPSKDIAKGTEIITGDKVVDGAFGTIKVAGTMLSDFKTVTNNVPENMPSGGAKLADPTKDPQKTPDPLAAINDLTAGPALFTPNPALALLEADGNPSAPSAPLAPLPPEARAAFLEKLAAIPSKPQSGGFGGTIPGQVFLYETRIAFLDVGKFYGSGYFMNRIGYKPEHAIPFLGDAYFENQLIDQQMRQLASQGLGKGSFIPGSDAIEQMKSLLDNGLDYAKAHNLSIGQALSSDQEAALTQSVVLYVKKNIKGVDVLAPVVYLAPNDKANITVAGAMMSGGSVNMNVGNLNNSGAIMAKTDLKLTATNIKADGGNFIAGGNADLSASQSMTLKAQTLNIAGTNVVNPNGGVQAGGNVKLHANDNLVVQGVNVKVGGDASLSAKNITLDVVKALNNGSQNATGAKIETGGSLSMKAQDTINVIGSSAKAGTSLEMEATKGSVNVVTADVARKTDDGYSKIAKTAQQQSQLSSGTDTKITAGDDILLSGSKVNAGGNVGLKAGDDINITAAQSQSTTKFGKNSSSDITHTGSEIIAGGKITALAGNVDSDGNLIKGGDHDLSIIGSKLQAGGKVDLKASDGVSIAEATDSSTLDMQSSGKKKGGLFRQKINVEGHTETSTAIGSSISGGTGIDIVSGGDTVISASKLKAGPDKGGQMPQDKKAGINITTGGDLTIASGKNTLERHDKSSGKGFLTKKSSSLDGYDESIVGSDFDASGGINLNAGKDALISGSKLHAGDGLHVEGDSVSIIGAQEDHSLTTQSKKSGLFAGGGDGFYSLWGKNQKDNKNTSTLNVGSDLSAGQGVSIKARKTDLNIVGSDVTSGKGYDTDLDAVRDVNILPGAESMSKEEKEKRSGFGIQVTSGNGSASIGIGYGSQTDQLRQGSNTNAVSRLHAGHDLNIHAGRDLNSQGGQLSAERDLNPTAGHDQNYLSGQDKTNYAAMHEKLFAGVSASVSSGLLASANNAADAASRVSSVSGTKAVSNVAIASLNAYKALEDAKGLLKGNGTLGSISATIGFEQSKSEQNGGTSTPIPTTLRAGHAINFDTGHDLIGKGMQMNAGVDATGKDISDPNDKQSGLIKFKVGHDVLLESAQELSDHSGKNSSAGAGIGLGINLGLTNGVLVPSAGLTLGGHFGKGRDNGASVTQLNTHVNAKHIELDIGNDMALKGAVINSGDAVTGKVGGNLTIESRLDTRTEKSRQLNVNAGLNAGALDLNGTIQKGDGDAAIVGEQSGIHAGSSGFDLEVGGKTKLIGGLITSQAPEDKNHLTTGTLEASDLDTHSDWKARTYGGGISGGLPFVAPSMKEGETETGKARSAIAPGTIIITDPVHQSQNIADINRDTANTNTSLPGIPDLKKVLDEQYKTQAELQAAMAEAAGLSGRIADDFARNATTEEGRKFWDTGGLGRSALHAAAGALLGGVNDVAGAIKGALGGAIATLTAPQIHELVEKIVAGTKLGGTPQGEALVNGVTSSIVQSLAAGVGGGDAAAYAGNEVKYNYLTHQEIEKFNLEMVQCGQDTKCQFETYLRYAKSSADRNDEVSACDNEECRQELYDGFLKAKEVANSLLNPFNHNNDQFYTLLSALQSNEVNSAVNEIALAREHALSDAKEDCGADDSCTRKRSQELFNNWAHEKDNKQLIAFVSGVILAVRPGENHGSKKPGAGPTGPQPKFNQSGHRADFYDEAGNPLKWRNPLTNQIEDIPPGMNLHKDHLFPIKEIEDLRDFGKLSPAQQKQLLNDPMNYQPMEGSMNCSKGCKVEGTPNQWDTYKGQPLSPEYKQWLEKEQDKMKIHFEELIKNMAKGGGGK